MAPISPKTRVATFDDAPNPPYASGMAHTHHAEVAQPGSHIIRKRAFSIESRRIDVVRRPFTQRVQHQTQRLPLVIGEGRIGEDEPLSNLPEKQPLDERGIEARLRQVRSAAGGDCRRHDSSVPRSARRRRSPCDLVGVDAEQRLSMRRCVRVAQRVGVDRSDHRDGGMIVFSIALRIQKVDRAANHHAPPIESTLDFVDLEGDPRMVLDRGELRAWRRPDVEPTVGIDVRDRLDVDAIVKCEREPTDMVALEQRDRIVAR